MNYAIAPKLQEGIQIAIKLKDKTFSKQFTTEKITIGRSEENSIVLEEDQKISRVHAEITFENGEYVLANLSQKNQIFVNYLPVLRKTLRNNDVIQMGDSSLTVQFNSTKAEIKSDTLMLLNNPTQNAIKTESKPANSLAPQNLKISPVNNNPNPVLNIQQSQSLNQSTQQGLNQNVHHNVNQQYLKKLQKNGNENQKLFIVALIIIGGLFFFMFNENKNKNKLQLRSQQDILKDIEESELAVKEIESNHSDSGKNSIQFKTAQEHYIKGFRDYRLGQYSRAIQSFQAALSFYPQHTLAQKYLSQSKRKFDELIDFNLMQGHKYLAKNNFRMCKSAFAKVLVMTKDPNELKYKEAKQFYDECSLKLEDKY